MKTDFTLRYNYYLHRHLLFMARWKVSGRLSDLFNAEDAYLGMEKWK